MKRETSEPLGSSGAGLASSIGKVNALPLHTLLRQNQRGLYQHDLSQHVDRQLGGLNLLPSTADTFHMKCFQLKEYYFVRGELPLEELNGKTDHRLFELFFGVAAPKAIEYSINQEMLADFVKALYAPTSRGVTSVQLLDRSNQWKVRYVPGLPTVRGSGILLAQELLTQLGYDPGPLDSALGPKMTSALESFQKDRGLAGDGYLDSTTMLALVEHWPLTNERSSLHRYLRVGKLAELSPDAQQFIITNTVLAPQHDRTAVLNILRALSEEGGLLSKEELATTAQLASILTGDALKGLEEQYTKPGRHSPYLFLDRGFDGDTNAANLSQILVRPVLQSFHPHRLRIVNETLAALYNPLGNIDQGLQGTCAPTSVQKVLFKNKPGEAVYQISGLVQDGAVLLKGDIQLSLPTRMRTDELTSTGGTTIPTFLWNCAGMEYANGTNRYDPVTGKHLPADPTHVLDLSDSFGLKPDQIQYLATAVLGEEYIVRPLTGNNLIRYLAIASPYKSFIATDWGDDVMTVLDSSGKEITVDPGHCVVYLGKLRSGWDYLVADPNGPYVATPNQVLTEPLTMTAHNPTEGTYGIELPALDKDTREYGSIIFPIDDLKRAETAIKDK